MSERIKTAQYRRCYLTDGQGKDASDGKNLQMLLTTASATVAKPWTRPIGVGTSACQLLAHLVPKNLCLCGQLVYYEDGRKIPLVDVEKDGTTWQDNIHPTDGKGRKRKFQEQSLFFAVRENHVAIIQSVSLQTDELQDYLEWFVKDKAQLVPNALIALQNLPAQSAFDKLKDHQIRGIKFGDRLFTHVKEERPPTPGKAPPKRKRYTHHLKTSPRIVEILGALGIEQPIIDNLSADPDPGSIQVDVEISYRSRTEKEAISVLRSLASTLGKQDGLDTEIMLSGKSSIRGEELTLRGQVHVQCPDGCISPDDAFTKLSRWLADQIKTGKVT